MIIGVIPARFASNRFPGKLLADLRGKPVLQWTWEMACRAESLERVIIAAADEKIATAAREFGAEVVEHTLRSFPAVLDSLVEFGLDLLSLLLELGDDALHRFDERRAGERQVVVKSFSVG